jgi:hypothetical protein
VPVFLFQHHERTCIRNAPLDGRVGFTWKRQRNIGKRQRNIASLEECDRLAEQAKTDGERKILEEMAKAWRMVAAEADNKR